VNRRAGWAWGLAVGLLLAPAAEPQSLGEAAAREKAKREKRGKATPAPSYTDEDLKDPNKPADQDKDKDKDSSTTAPPSTGTNVAGSEAVPRRVPRTPPPEGGPGVSPTGVSPPSVGAGDEAIWRTRAREHRDAVHNAEKSIQEAQDRLNALMLDRDVTNTGDPNRLQTLEARRAEARASLEGARLGLAEAQKALQDLEEEARRNSVPPGWLREP
jgi:hypothetical protein